MSIKGYPKSMLKLVAELSKLPSVGHKSAARLAYSLLLSEKIDARTLASAILNAKENIKLCSKCFHLSEEEFCDLCLNTSRDASLVCVVDKPADVLALEASGVFSGYYHVLHGLWSPLRGVSPDKIKLRELFNRVREDSQVKEILVATPTTVEGDATALFISQELEGDNLTVTRIAQGLPKGGELEYADVMTLSYAISGRKAI